MEDLTINVWMGPLTTFSHAAHLGCNADLQYHVSADYVPRGANVMGGDPQYMQAYYNESS
jgi:hypothetical protein